MRAPAGGPTIYLVVGVNGTGKTTSIGKLALEFARQGKTVMLIAADTFRAAAVEQLGIWAERTGACLVSSEREGADPASVCFEGLAEAAKSKPDVVLIDTAGRLHTKRYLMDELGKVIRVIKKSFPDAPHETILVIDATTGQNALSQVNTFREVAELTGLVMTKLDGTAKGGILVAIKQAHPDLPVFRIGIGEAPEDLRPFRAEQFSRALFDIGGS
jgi:fused signal recognition particle receptor